MRTSVNVDGFNFYYGAVKGTAYKWLDIRRYCELAFTRNTIYEVHYCTAIVSDAPWDPQQSLRERTFIRAFEATGVEIHYGSFLKSTLMMPLANPRNAALGWSEVIKTEEKGSDVNPGALLVATATRGGMRQQSSFRTIPISCCRSRSSYRGCDCRLGS